METIRNRVGRTFRQIYGLVASWIPCILVCLFGLSSWLAINGLWAEMPALVPVLPEGERLPSMIVIIIQLANIGPMIYLITSSVTSYVKKKRVDLEIPAVFIIVLLGVVTCVLLAFLWDHKSFLFNKTRSVSLLVLSFFLALVDCTSTLVYIPYMERFPDRYISALFMGEGFGALFPSLVALLQGSYNNITNNTTNSGNISTVNDDNSTSSSDNGLLFSVDVFFVLLAIMTLISGGAFVLLNQLPSCKRLMVRQLSLAHPDACKLDSSSLGCTSDPISSNGKNSNMLGDIETSPLILTPQSNKQHTFKEVIGCVKISPRIKELFLLTDLLVQIAWLNLLTNGAIPAVSVFVFLPYGNSTYHLAANLGIVVGPIAAFATMFLPCVSRYFIILWTLISSTFGVAIIVLAALSPHLPMVGSNWGDFIVVSGGLVVYVTLGLNTCRFSSVFYLLPHWHILKSVLLVY